jgi:anti-anti-sigma factor
VSASGELDLATSPRLEQTLRESLRHARLVLVDLHEVSFIDFAGLHIIVDVSKEAREAGRRLLIVGLSEQANALFT